MWQYNYDCELYHHGILGMKWGVRRFQNKNGSLTSAGKKRKMSQDARDVEKLKKKKIYQMSNAELKKINERRNLEKNYRNTNPSKLVTAGKYIKTGLGVVGVVGGAMGSIVAIKKNYPEVLKIGQELAEKYVKRG